MADDEVDAATVSGEREAHTSTAIVTTCPLLTPESFLGKVFFFRNFSSICKKSLTGITWPNSGGCESDSLKQHRRRKEDFQ